MTNILYKEESYAIIGGCFEVYNEMGSGYLEAVYHECLRLEFFSRRVPFESKLRLNLRYKSQALESYYIPDFACYDQIILEIKAQSGLTDIDRAQIHNYLKGTGARLGLLVNFGSHPKLQYERIVR